MPEQQPVRQRSLPPDDGAQASGDDHSEPAGVAEVTAESPVVGHDDTPVADGDRPEPPERKVPKDALVIGRRKVLVITAGIAVASLVAGMVASSRITSPEEAAAKTQPPDAEDITVPVEMRALRSEVVTRGDAVYDGASEVVVETAAMDEPAMVTGSIPEVGDELEAGKAILELAGRPVVALVGDLPVYRSLTPGMSGPDVAQLKAALNALGLDAGDASDDEYDRKTADAVAALFDRAGYEAPEPDEEAVLTLESAEEAVELAQEALDDAIKAQQEAQNSQDVQPAGMVPSQENDQPAGDEGDAGDDAGEGESGEPGGVAEGPGGDTMEPDPSSVPDAQSELNDAQVELAEAQLAAATPLPASEVVFLPKLPRRVDSVGAERGKVLSGTALEVSGADLVVQVAVAAGDASLVKEGMDVVLEVGDDTVNGKVTEIREDSGEESGDEGSGDGDGDGDGDGEQGDGNGDGEGDGEGDGATGSGIRAIIKPGDLSVEQEEEIRGTNLRVTIPVEATDGEVMAVPLAALTAGPGGESRVEVAHDDGETRLVEVEVGLAAEGFAEIEPVDDSLADGDQVVVGR